MNKITVLGSGSSTGVPVVGCSCSVCLSTDTKNKRSRPSVFIETAGGVNILIDATTDFRYQAIAHRIERIDAVFLTHGHADHILGLDDLRPFNFVINRSIELFSTPDTFRKVRSTFSYIFDEKQDRNWVVKFAVNEIDEYQPFYINGLEVKPFAMKHGSIRSTGYRIGNFSYATDCNYIPDRSISVMSNSDYLIIDALREKPSPTHFSISEAYAAALKIKAKQTYVTHLNHEVDHSDFSNSYPANFQPAFDGMVIYSD
jgi:phosphoribosyl 1,2-cyclic phosphate phosphodiesterase